MQFYPQDVLARQIVLEAVRIVARRVTIPGARLAFVADRLPADRRDRRRTSSHALGVEVLRWIKVLGSINYLPLNVGEAWGYLRIFPARQRRACRRPTSRCSTSCPLDLSVVAGMITRAVQDTNSHVNLKSKERGTPNMVLRDAGPDHPRLAPFADQPVHLVVRRDDFLIEPTTDERSPRSWPSGSTCRGSRWSGSPRHESARFDEMAAGTAARTRWRLSAGYGGKAANLGFLAHRDVLGRVDDPGSPERASRLRPRAGRLRRAAAVLPATSSSIRRTPTLRAEIEALVAGREGGPAVPEGARPRSEEVQPCYHGELLPDPVPWQAIRAAS